MFACLLSDLNLSKSPNVCKEYQRVALSVAFVGLRLKHLFRRNWIR
jgi:hypothetical protein